MTAISKEPDTVSRQCPSKRLFLIPGENVVKTMSIVNCSLSLTNYRLYIIYKAFSRAANSHIGIPLTVILKIEQLEFKYIRLWTKLGNNFILLFESADSCTEWFKLLLDSTSCKTPQKLFAFRYFKSLPSTRMKGHIGDCLLFSDNNMIQYEFDRMRFDKELWKITGANGEFRICNSYPRYHIVPQSITDADINAMAEFRGNRRFPSVVWRSQRNGSVIIRCAQPQVGLMFWRNTFDETFFKEVMDCLRRANPCGSSRRMVIVDARHYSTAQFNRIRGGGVEYSEYYGEAEISYMQLENIHNVRASFDHISTFAMSSADNWLTNVEASYWLRYLSKLLKSANDIARILVEDGRSVIIHCSDGWDRTPQLTSLTQLLADGFYRTVKGFEMLIEREWLQFGHKFSDRCAFSRPFDDKERSPVFVQWLDCVYQIFRQFPRHFEFNETFLIKLAIHVHSGLFGNFLFNTTEDRTKFKVHESTTSLWNFLSESNESILNPLYYKLYQDDDESDSFEGVIYTNYNIKFLYPWNRLFFEALCPLEAHKIFSLEYCSSKQTTFQNTSMEDVHEEVSSCNDSLNNLCNLRKFKSESDLSSCDMNCYDLIDTKKSESCDVNDVKNTSKFINQSSSSLTLNDPISNGYANDYSHSQNIDQKSNRFQQIELVAFTNGFHSDPSVNGIHKLNGSYTNKSEHVRPYSNNNNGNHNHNPNPSHSNNDKIQKKNQYFRLVHLEDTKECSISTNNAPCDDDGIYKYIEPVNMASRHWKSLYEAQKTTIQILQDKLLTDSVTITKSRDNSISSVERPRNEDSLSSHDSYVLLDSPKAAIFNSNKAMNVYPVNGSLSKSRSLRGANDGGFLRKANCCNKELMNETSCARQFCETANNSEKAQA